MHWSHWLGIDNGNDWTYLLYSGLASFILSLSVLGGFATIYKHRQCHQEGCWRIGHHPAADGQLVLCRKHHPDIKGRRLTTELVAELHKITQRK